MYVLSTRTLDAPLKPADAAAYLAGECRANASELMEFYRFQFMLDAEPEEALEYYAAGVYEPVDDPGEFIVTAAEDSDNDQPGRLKDMFEASGWSLEAEPDPNDELPEILLRSNVDGYLSAVLISEGNEWQIQLEID